MPAIYTHSTTRRGFLKRSTQMALVIAFGSTIRARGQGSGASEKAVRFVLLSDTHVAANPKEEFRKFLPWENLELAVKQASQIPFEGVIHCGDAARTTGEVGDYEGVKKLLEPLAARGPVCLMLGNHDHRENLSKVFTALPGSRQPVTDKLVVVLEQTLLRVVLLDSLLYTNKTPGFLGKAQREWLQGFLSAADDRPTIVFVHHTLGDADGELLDVQRFLPILRAQRKVKAVFYGHSHEYNVREDEGMHLVNLPAVGYNFNDREPVGWVDATFTSAGAKLQLHAFGGNRSQDTQVKSLSWRS